MNSRGIRWVVGCSDGPTLGEVLRRAGVDPDALADGRVFVDRHRSRNDAEPVRVGDVVSVAPRARPKEASRVEVLATCRDLVAIDKPAGIPTIADHAGSAHSVQGLAAKALGVDPNALHPTSRLDRDVSGVIIFARSPVGASRLLEARAQGLYSRRYVAIASNPLSPPRGRWDFPVGRAANPRLREVGGRDPIPASTRYAMCKLLGSGTALATFAPETGRTHQIRVHASHAGAPLVGDRAYGGRVSITLPTGGVVAPRRIALHAARVSVPRAVLGRRTDSDVGPAWVVSSPVPHELIDLGRALGLAPHEWEDAVSCDLSFD